MACQVSEAVQMEMEDKKQRKTRERKPRVARDPTASVGANGKYSRYDSQVAAMQRDSGTYCDEPADAAAFAEWLAGASSTTRWVAWLSSAAGFPYPTLRAANRMQRPTSLWEGFQSVL
jgi:hypothetical protein